MKLAIKNMVCPRCLNTIRSIANELGLAPYDLELGQIEFAEPPEKTKLEAFRRALEKEGFSILESKSARLINAIKSLILDRLETSAENRPLKLSAYLSQELHYDYSHLSRMFSSVEGITIERYFNAQRIEKAKEYLSYQQDAIAQVADALGFSSPAHFAAQFKQETGMTPSQFRKLSHPPRRSLDAV